ncbi:hypothetical protein [Aequorivita nionensis]|uniref:hypothetical protein n=1 Tax=Aequorivita nionensis TaxID=1287690 RepID=UPI003965B98D
MIKLTHIINPVNVSEASDLFVAQPVTFESMRRAKQFAASEIEVSLITTQYPEDHSVIPEFFTKTKDLDRSVLDFGTFDKKRKLPLLQDILDRAVDYNTEADYIVYTNVDIAVQPHFYSFINQKIKDGHDAFVINRRTISKQYTLKTLADAYADYGEAHPGFDCFVFKLKLHKQLSLNNVAIGVSKVGITLLANLIAFTDNLFFFKKEHLTFHIGEDKVWLNKNLNDYYLHNCNEAFKVYKHLINKKPEIINNAIIKKHWLLLNKELNNETEISKTEQKTGSVQKVIKWLKSNG